MNNAPPTFYCWTYVRSQTRKAAAVTGGCWEKLLVWEMPPASQLQPISNRRCFLSFLLSFLILAFRLPATRRKPLHACRHTDSVDQRGDAAHPWRSLTRFQGNTQQDNGLYLAIPARPHHGSTSKRGPVSSKQVKTDTKPKKFPIEANFSLVGFSWSETQLEFAKPCRKKRSHIIDINSIPLKLG